MRPLSFSGYYSITYAEPKTKHVQDKVTNHPGFFAWYHANGLEMVLPDSGDNNPMLEIVKTMGNTERLQDVPDDVFERFRERMGKPGAKENVSREQPPETKGNILARITEALNS